MIPVHALLDNVKHFEGWRYVNGNGHYPNQLPGVKLPRPPPRNTDCCCFAEYVIVKAAVDHVEGFTWNLDRHKQMMIMGRDRFSPVAAMVESGVGEEFEGIPTTWTLCQGWRDGWRSGHTFIVAEGGPSIVDPCLIVDAGLSGIGFRRKGGHRAVAHPGEHWRRYTNWTWEKIVREFPNLAMARLFVE